MPTGRHLPVLLVYGSMLGLMNVLIYQAFSRIPIGIAIAIEVLGPLSVVLCGARRPLDLAWLVAAGLGLWLLLPISTNSVSLDPVGIAFAAGAAGAWALYVVYGKQVARFPEMDAVAWGNGFGCCHHRSARRMVGRFHAASPISSCNRTGRGSLIQRGALHLGNVGFASALNKSVWCIARLVSCRCCSCGLHHIG